MLAVMCFRAIITPYNINILKSMKNELCVLVLCKGNPRETGKPSGVK